MSRTIQRPSVPLATAARKIFTLGPNAQMEPLHSNCNVPLDYGTVLGYEVGMTGEGKGMKVAKYSPDGKCWSCDDHDGLEPVEGVDEQVTWGLSSGPSRPGVCWGLCPCKHPSLQCKPKKVATRCPRMGARRRGWGVIGT